MRRKITLLMLFSIIILRFQCNVFAAQELCEKTQVISGYNAISGTTINARSPFRTGDTGTGTDFNPIITSQFNQPRLESGVKRVHAGVDFQALTNGTGRKVFSSYGQAKVYSTGIISGYGESVSLEHEHTDGAKKYYFQSFYAHLASRSLTGTTSLYTLPDSKQVGVEGKTGATTAIHLHQEFRTPGSGTYRYSPTVFYYHKGTFGLNTTFMNYTGAASNKVTFNVVSVDCGNTVDVLAGKVKIYYKKSGASTFSSANMAKSGNNFTHTFTGYPIGTKIIFYVEAQEKCWDGNYYKAYRPFYDRLSNPPPDSKCFTYTTLSTTASSTALTSQNAEASNPEELEFALDSGKAGNSKVDIPWIPEEEGIKKGLDIMNISFLAKVTNIDEDGIVYVESVTGAEMLKKKEYRLFETTKKYKPGQEYAVKLNFEFEPEINQVYRLKGTYDNKEKIINVYDPVFFYGYCEEQ